MMKALAPVMVIIALLSPAFALSCENLAGQQHDLCMEIAHLNISEEEKNMLLTLALYTERDKPNHDFIALWNQQINFTTAPANVPVYNQGTIKDAWIKIIALSPSVLENQTLSCDSSGTIQTAYNYRIQLPQGTESGDCQTYYSLNSDNTQLKIYANNNFIGNNKINLFSLDHSQATFTSILDLNVKTQVQHYRDERYCCRRSGNRCTRYCNRCSYSNTEIRTNILQINDNIQAFVKAENPVLLFNITNQYLNTTRGTIKPYNATRLSLSFQNSSYSSSNYVYDFQYSLQPYNVLNLVAHQQSQHVTNNILIEPRTNSFDFIVSNTNNCTLSASTHFRTGTFSCNLSFEQVNLKLKADKFYYKPNETINVTIEPSDKLVRVIYGNETKIIQGNTSFIAEYPTNKLSVKYQEQQFDAFISVIEPNHLLMAWRIFLFSFVIYLVFNFITKSPFAKWSIVD